MKTRGLQRREEKEIIRQQKAESKKAAAFESTLLDILPTLDQSIGYDSGGFYTEIWAENMWAPITNPNTLKEVFEITARAHSSVKTVEERNALLWLARFQSDEKAADFLRYLSPEGFKALTPS